MGATGGGRAITSFQPVDAGVTSWWYARAARFVRAGPIGGCFGPIDMPATWPSKPVVPGGRGRTGGRGETGRLASGGRGDTGRCPIGGRGDTARGMVGGRGDTARGAVGGRGEIARAGGRGDTGRTAGPGVTARGAPGVTARGGTGAPGVTARVVFGRAPGIGLRLRIPGGTGRTGAPG